MGRKKKCSLTEKLPEKGCKHKNYSSAHTFKQTKHIKIIKKKNKEKNKTKQNKKVNKLNKMNAHSIESN